MGDVCNHLLRDPETLEFIAGRGPGGKACFVMMDEETQALARQAGLEVMHPPVELRHRLGSKIVMTRLADEAGVPSVPHVIGRAGSYDELSGARARAPDWEMTSSSWPLMATPAAGRSLCAASATGTSTPVAWPAQEVKVMKRIRNVEVCLEGAVTRHGTVIGPAMTSLVGYSELTPHRGQLVRQ